MRFLHGNGAFLSSNWQDLRRANAEPLPWEPRQCIALHTIVEALIVDLRLGHRHKVWRKGVDMHVANNGMLLPVYHAAGRIVTQQDGTCMISRGQPPPAPAPTPNAPRKRLAGQQNEPLVARHADRVSYDSACSLQERICLRISLLHALPFQRFEYPELFHPRGRENCSQQIRTLIGDGFALRLVVEP